MKHKYIILYSLLIPQDNTTFVGIEVYFPNSLLSALFKNNEVKIWKQLINSKTFFTEVELTRNETKFIRQKIKYNIKRLFGIKPKLRFIRIDKIDEETLSQIVTSKLIN